jgi:hypothetical protein
MSSIRLAAMLGFAIAAFAAAPVLAASQASAKPAASSSARRTLSGGVSTVEPNALQALQKMSAYLKTLATAQVTTQTTLDLVSDDGQKIQLDGTARYKIRRPDAFVIDVDTDFRKRRYIYDGKRFTVFSPDLGYYATVAAPPTIRATLDAIWKRFHIALPLEDLFRWSDPGGARETSLKAGYDLGPVTIDGAQTEHLAFREGDIDWEIWIQKADQPLPRKLSIVDRTDPALPRYTARLSWDVNPTFAADEFVFTPRQGDKDIRLALAAK